MKEKGKWVVHSGQTYYPIRVSGLGVLEHGCMQMPLLFDGCHAHVGYWDGMDVERTISDIEQLQEMFEAPDIRLLSDSDISAANRRHDEKLAHSTWFQLLQNRVPSVSSRRR